MISHSIRLLVILILVTSCAHKLERQELQNLDYLSHEECIIKKEDLELPLFIRTSRNLESGIKSSGSYALTTVGYATDVVIFGGVVVGMVWLCGESSGGSCVDAVGNMLKLSAHAADATELKGFGSSGYEATSSWRCPYVDHISQAIRDSAKCNMKKGHFSAAFAHLDLLETNLTLKKCISDREREHLQVQLLEINSQAVPN